MKATYIISLITLSLHLALYAQPTPASPQTTSVLILGATAHIGNGETIENSAIAFDNGKLTLIADAQRIRIDSSQYGLTILAYGQHAYPGFIAPNTQLGLREIDQVRATVDDRETGRLNPNIRALIAYNTDSDILPTVRSNGILLAQITPKGGFLSGTSSIVQLDAWNWEDAAYRTDDGQHLRWPRRYTFDYDWTNPPGKTRPNKHYNQQIERLTNLFSQAKAYANTPNPKQKNLKLKALSYLFTGQQQLYIHVKKPQAIIEAVLFAKRFELQPVIIGGQGAWAITDFLKAHKVSIILQPSHSLPANTGEAVSQPFEIAATLHKAGIPFAFSAKESWEQRNLPFQAGQAVAYGLNYEAAIAALTLQTAKIFGISTTTGSLEEGKDATLFISKGDALDMRGCQVLHAFIQGRQIDIDNRQKALYRKYQTKYKQSEK